MNYAKNIILFLLFTSAIWSCSKDQPKSTADNETDKVHIYQELLNMEYALLISDYTNLKYHSTHLDELLIDGYNLFCPAESNQINGARFTNKMLVKHVNNGQLHKLPDDLRILKASIINLETDDDYDPYFSFLWRFEEEMDAATQIAMDPMLDLLEWNEFTYRVDCMNNSWQSVKMHRPSPEILNHDPEKFKNQSVFKIYLKNAIEEFIKGVELADYEQYPLCELAEEVRKTYIAYIKTFIQDPIQDDSFLAKL